MKAQRRFELYYSMLWLEYDISQLVVTPPWFLPVNERTMSCINEDPLLRWQFWRPNFYTILIGDLQLTTSRLYLLSLSTRRRPGVRAWSWHGWRGSWALKLSDKMTRWSKPGAPLWVVISMMTLRSQSGKHHIQKMSSTGLSWRLGAIGSCMHIAK